MYIRVSDIPREGLDVFSVQGRDRIPHMLEEMDPYPLKAVRLTDASLLISEEGRNLFLTGSFAAEGEALCDRCADPFTVRMEREFQTVLVPRDEGPAGSMKMEISGGDLEVAYYDGLGIEVEDVFWEQVAVAIPVKLLCRDDCRGICPHCGANRDREPCGCPDDTAQSPFGVLRKLLDENK